MADQAGERGLQARGAAAGEPAALAAAAAEPESAAESQPPAMPRANACRRAVPSAAGLGPQARHAAIALPDARRFEHGASDRRGAAAVPRSSTSTLGAVARRAG